MSTCRTVAGRIALIGTVLAVGAGQGWAQDTTARPIGLPKKFQWTFNLDAGLGAFGFANSLYTNAHDDPSGNLSDNWVESFAKPGISGTLGLGKGELYGKISGVGERTFAAPPPLVGEEASSFQVEDLYLGWRSETVDLTVGRARYTLGQGLILWDGGGEGGTRGGFWSNARKAWAFAGIARLTPKHHKLEAFYLNRDEVPESETGTKLWGGNYELSLGDGANTFGVTYLQFEADPAVKPERDGLSVINARAFLAPLKSIPDLSFVAEYAKEENGDLLKSTAWNALGAYQFSKIAWKPKLSYRYAFFEGDDPATATNEGFDALLPGFYDWGTWWQGEIGGEYFLSNSNLISHQARLHLTPSDALSGGLIGFSFLADQPASFGTNVTEKSIAVELDGYADWKVNSNFTISFLAAIAHPQEAVVQGYDRTKNFIYGMIYVAYAY